jgi:ATP-dependent DNA helicase RecQ
MSDEEMFGKEDVNHCFGKVNLGHKKLKKEQLDTILHILNGKDVFLVLPTGYGKSICLFLPPLFMDILVSIYSLSLQ